LDFRLLETRAQIDAIGDEWDRLWRSQRVRHVFQSVGWHRAILDAHGERRPCVVTASDGGRLLGLLPLARAGRTLCFLGAPYADYCDLLTDVRNPGRLFEGMVDALERAGFRSLRLENVREDAVLRRAAVDAGAKLARRLRWQAGAVCPTTLLDVAENVTASAILRKKSLRRHEHKLARRGTLRFEHIADAGRARALLPAFFRQHVERRAAAGDESLFLRREARDFYEALIARLGLEVVRFALLELDGSAVAFHVGFECDRRFTWYKPSFDVRWSRYSPGEVLLKKLFEYARRRGVVEFDFTRGEEPFKARFANASQTNRTLFIFPPGLRGSVQAHAFEARGRLKRIGWLRTVSRWIRDITS